MFGRRALVTGASRGIGKAIALALAEKGYRVAVSARTINAGEIHPNGEDPGDSRPLPGSLSETVREIDARGGQGLAVPLDLTDRASVGAAGQLVLDRWGGVDVLVHNGRHLGAGLMDRFLDTPTTAYDKFYEAHCVAPIALTKLLLPGMLERGLGYVVTITSAAGYTAPPAPAGSGGWGLGYAVGKASGHVLVGTLNAEFGDRGVLAFNVDPGAVLTERKIATSTNYGVARAGGMAPPSVVGAAVAWLVTSPEGESLIGETVVAQELALKRGLHPPWNEQTNGVK